MTTPVIEILQEGGKVSVTPSVSEGVKISGNSSRIEITLEKNTEAEIRYRCAVEGTEDSSMLIKVGEGSTLVFVENVTSSGSADRKNTTDVKLEENARVTYVSLQSLDEASQNNSVKRATLGKNAGLNWVIAQTGGGKSSTLRETFLQGQGAQAEDVEVFFGSGSQNYNITSNMYHNVPDTAGNVLVKGVLTGNAYSASKGMIKVAKGAQKTNSYLSEHTLILSKDAKSDAVPGLEIEANDVKASHSASVSQIDEEQIFYLTSRGLASDDARKLIVLGFLEAAFQKVSADFSSQFREAIEKKWEKVAAQ